MSVRESTSIELPKALSGSNVLMAWPGVTSTRTVDWANAAVASAVKRNGIWAETRAAFMSSYLEQWEQARSEGSALGKSRSFAPAALRMTGCDTLLKKERESREVPLILPIPAPHRLQELGPIVSHAVLEHDLDV